MATIKEILEIESSRESQSDTSVINLFQEGSFLRAYELSAWLCVKYLHEFNATKRLNKSIGQEVVFIGFPNTSLKKWLPEGCEVQNITDKHHILSIPVRTDNISVESFEQWKSEIPISDGSRDSSKLRDNAGVKKNGKISMTEIMGQILSFPLESKSPIECMLFIAELKKQLVQII